MELATSTASGVTRARDTSSTDALALSTKSPADAIPSVSWRSGASRWPYSRTNSSRSSHRIRRKVVAQRPRTSTTTYEAPSCEASRRADSRRTTAWSSSRRRCSHAPSLHVRSTTAYCCARTSSFGSRSRGRYGNSNRKAAARGSSQQGSWCNSFAGSGHSCSIPGTRLSTGAAPG